MTGTNQQWVLRQRPTARHSPDDLAFEETPVRQPDAGEVLVRNIYLSLDPTNRLWMSEREQYLPSVALGEVMRGSTIGVVEHSNAAECAIGDVVRVSGGGWQRYSTVPSAFVTPLPPIAHVPLSAHMSVLGLTGLTAYVGMIDIAEVKPGDAVVVSAAAGAVGSIAGQIAKIKGATVVGIAGGPDKCRWLTDALKFDGAIDYRNHDIGERLDALLPNGVDLDFENVGGAVMEAVFTRLNIHGRLALCGMISGYNQEGPLAGPADFGRILMRRLSIRGFTITDHFHRAPAAFAALSAWIGEGKIKWKDHVVAGLENAPDALALLFSGGNDGKLMVQISPTP